MTTQDDGATREESEARLARLNANIARMDSLSRRLTEALAHRRQADTALNGPGQDVFLKASAAWMAEMMQNPAKVLEQQVGYWGRTLQHYAEAQKALASGALKAPDDPGPKDRRFANPLWDSHPYFNYVKQQYLLNAEAITSAVQHLPQLSPADQKRVDYFTRQIVDMFAPTNFLGTNPDALEKAVATDGKPCPGYRGERGGSAGHPCRWRGFRGWREPWYHSGFRGLSQPDDGTDPVRPVH
jgi:polyhydroxyalkanoate synthase subunit PhaC